MPQTNPLILCTGQWSGPAPGASNYSIVTLPPDLSARLESTPGSEPSHAGGRPLGVFLN
jgi:hypothetical protein